MTAVMIGCIGNQWCKACSRAPAESPLDKLVELQLHQWRFETRSQSNESAEKNSFIGTF